MEPWEKPRYDQLIGAVPDLFDSESILYIGAHEGRIQFGDLIQERGMRVDILEIWNPNVEHLRTVSWFNRVIEGDVRDVERYVDRRYDVVFWWHGPEHIEKRHLLTTLKSLEAIAKRWVVLGCPWGRYPQGEEYGNPYEVHRSAFYKRDFQRYGYRVSTIGQPDVPGSNLMAWKDVSAGSGFAAGEAIPDGVGEYGEYQIDLNDDFEAIETDLEVLRGLNPPFPCHVKVEGCTIEELKALNRAFKDKVITGMDFAEGVRSRFPLVGIVMFTYDRLDYTKTALAKLMENTEYPFNLHIIDNHSTDGTVEWLRMVRHRYPSIRSITFNPENRGLPGPTNEFWRRVNADLVGKVDNDVIVPKGWLYRLVDAHLKASGAAIIGVYHFRPEDFDEAGARAKLFAENGVQLVADTHICGCCYLMKKRVQEQVGYMVVDPRLKIHGWTEYQHRVVDAGYAVGYLYPLLFLEYMDDPRSRWCLIDRKYRDYTARVWRERGVEFRTTDQLVEWLRRDAARVTGSGNRALERVRARREALCGGDGGSKPESDSPSPNYYTFSRPEVRALIDPNAARVLDVGCAEGVMGGELKASLGAEVWGIEFVPEAAERAKQRLDRVLVGTVEENLDKLPDGGFDAVIFADVLEHLVDPGTVLARMRRKLSPRGEVIASVPNVRHWSVLKGLIEGRWDYRDAGILDRSHLRFFTRASLLEMFRRAGYRVDGLKATALKGGGITARELKGLRATGLDVSTLKEESGHYQYLVKASPVKTARGERVRSAGGERISRPLASIIILTCNAWEYTEKCVESVRRHTDYPHEIIFVDNNSTDGTRDRLRNLVKELPNSRLIENRENRGFAAGNNQGVEAAAGKFVMLLNNDVLVADGWLTGLVESLERDERIGAVGPLTNFISGRQMVAQIPYTDEDGFYAFAAELRRRNRRRLTPRRRLAGFAILMRRSLYREVGGFDEGFGAGNFEDDDLCLRVRRRGYALMVDESVFIHHYGNRTFIANGIPYRESLEERLPIFERKWRGVDYEELIEVKNPLSEAHPRLLERATVKLLSGDLDRAVEDFSAVNAEDPLSQDALFGLALCHTQRGEFDEGLRRLHRLIELNPDHAPAYNQAGLISLYMGDMEGAETLFEAAVKRAPDFIEARRNRAELLLMTGEFNRAVEAFEEVVERSPGDVPALVGIARAFAGLGESDRAKEFARRVLEHDPENETALELV